jgi:hypothetical protein
MSASLAKCSELALIAADGAMRDPASHEACSGVSAEAEPIALIVEQLVAAQAMRLLLRLDNEILEARAQWNQDWFRRLMRIRPKAASRLKRRWAKLDPVAGVRLGILRRRYHASLARYLYEPRE